MSQPLLHDLVSVVQAPSLVLSGADGQLRPRGVQGWFVRDRRALSSLEVTLSGAEALSLAGRSVGAAEGRFTAVALHLGDSADPTVTVERRRRLDGEQLAEEITVRSVTRTPVRCELAVEATTDLAPIDVVRSGGAGAAVRPQALRDGLRWEERIGDQPVTVTLTGEPAPQAVDPATGRLTWPVALATGESVTVRLRASAGFDSAPAFLPVPAPPWSHLQVRAADVRLPRLVQQSLADLAGLLLRDAAGADDDLFVAAGSPWFLTLFGRDSLWAARMLLPLGTELAMGTLRTLARRQGGADVPETEEQPGKILHEMRTAGLELGDLSIPPLYYGSIDATPLWLVLLAESWRWGAPTDGVAALLPAAERCLAWLEEQADEGFLRYVDRSGRGLTNQGWKDSLDGVQWADGRLADPPIALSEVQGYAYQAAVLGADLLDAFGRRGGEHWREWATRLRERFRAAYWVGDEAGRYPAVALDRDGRPVDSVASNMGHLLGTGILDPEEARLVAGRLASPELHSGFGLRTLTTRSPRFSRLSYHGGAVWPHDTAIAVMGLAREGYVAEAAGVLHGLVEAAPAFDYRLPELYSGDSRADTPDPLPYPSSCRPQAWSAAAIVAGLAAMLGVQPDVPGGRVRVGRSAAPFTGLRLEGLRIGGRPAAATVDDAGVVTVETDLPVEAAVDPS